MKLLTPLIILALAGCVLEVPPCPRPPLLLDSSRIDLQASECYIECTYTYPQRCHKVCPVHPSDPALGGDANAQANP